MSHASTLPELTVGEPLALDALRVFPLYPAAGIAPAPAAPGVDYVLSGEAIAAGAVVVEEVGEAGSVPTLRVTNTGGRPVLFLEGEELRGAKQNRVLNTTVLVAAATTTTIPVSCVEQGRWAYRSRQFGASDSHTTAKMRAILKGSSHRSLAAGHGHRSDQGAVWSEVSRKLDALGTSSGTEALADAYEAHRTRIDRVQQGVPYAEGAVGLAVALGPKVVALDVFDKAATCQKVWDRLIRGVALDAIELAGAVGGDGASAASVASLLARANAAAWSTAPAAGLGHELRAEPDSQTHASALVVDEATLHGSVAVMF